MNNNSNMNLQNQSQQQISNSATSQSMSSQSQSKPASSYSQPQGMNNQANAGSMQNGMSSAQIDSNIDAYKKAQQNSNKNSMQ